MDMQACTSKHERYKGRPAEVRQAQEGNIEKEKKT